MANYARGITLVTSIRTANKAIIEVDALLVQRAREKAQRDNNDYLITMWQGANPEKLSPSDRDSLNDYLFGSEEGGTPEDLIQGIPVVR